MKDWDRKERDFEEFNDLLDRFSAEIIYDKLLIPMSYYVSCKTRPRLTGFLLLIFGYQGDNASFIKGIRDALENKKRRNKE